MLTKKQKNYLVFKRLIDIFGSVVGIIILSPLLIILGIITKLTSKGPMIFKHERTGRHFKSFKLYKFRSMKVNSPNISPAKISKQEQEKMETKWGSFMRKTSLDELPQLFNILFGHMSFIGPRPNATNEKEMINARLSYVPNAYEVKPGLGGYAQIYLHRNHDVEKKAEYDSYYVKHLSFWLDVKLFFLSFACFLGFNPGR